MDFSLLTFGELLHPLNGDLKNKIRNFEKQKKQILSAKYGLLFNQTRIYIYIYIYKYKPKRILDLLFIEKTFILLKYIANSRSVLPSHI